MDAWVYDPDCLDMRSLIFLLSCRQTVILYRFLHKVITKTILDK